MKLYNAVERNDIEDVVRLIEEGANLEQANYADETPLYCAAANGYTDIVLVLLAAGANATMAKSDGWTPLHQACWNARSIGTVLALLKYGADVNQATNGWTPFMMATVHGSVGFLKILLQAGATPEGRTSDGEDVFAITERLKEHTAPGVKEFLEKLCAKA